MAIRAPDGANKGNVGKSLVLKAKNNGHQNLHKV